MGSQSKRGPNITTKKELFKNNIKLRKRIRELEDILESIQGVIINNDNVRVQAKHIGSDLAVHLIFERIEKALSEKKEESPADKAIRELGYPPEEEK